MISFRTFLSDEGGTATIELVFIGPIIVMIFLASVESSYYMIRYVMLERSVDIVVRDIRLGKLDHLKGHSQYVQHDALKDHICRVSILNSLQTCKDSMKIWLQAVSTADFEMRAPPRFCVDRTEQFNPATDPVPGADEFKLGEDNEIMLMRICLKEYPLFPTSVVGAGLVAGGGNDGSYALVTTSIFVNEPE